MTECETIIDGLSDVEMLDWHSRFGCFPTRSVAVLVRLNAMLADAMRSTAVPYPKNESAPQKPHIETGPSGLHVPVWTQHQPAPNEIGRWPTLADAARYLHMPRTTVDLNIRCGRPCRCRLLTRTAPVWWTAQLDRMEFERQGNVKVNPGAGHLGPPLPGEWIGERTAPVVPSRLERVA